MKWVEIINIQSAGTNATVSREAFQHLIKNAQSKWQGVPVTLFQHSRLSSDFSIFVNHPSTEPADRGSEIGTYLAWLLKEFGFVNHAVWLEV